MSPPLSILDVIPFPEGATSHEALRRSLELVRLADRLGYTRYWFAEHHNLAGIASTTPEIMIALAAGATTRIRVGSGGVMLPNHAPLKVAEAFKMLEALYPGRIDLGIGRAPGTDPRTALALRRTREALEVDDFPEKLVELISFGKNQFPPGHPFGPVKALPEDVPLPPIVLLGSSGFSAQLSARLGMPFGFAAHFSPEPPDGPMLAYREQFIPGVLEKPHSILTVSVVCAPTDAEAERLASSIVLSFVRARTNQRARLPSPEEALAYVYSPFEREVAESIRAMQIFGSPETVKRRIDALVERTSADEVMVLTNTYGHAERLRSYELLAEAFLR
ncbi:LLM class flavin-dependent oxidoreductase [Hyalangium versicolor]|uniref:LLM class flavin-dependent oxidoreductase n=1 Tax=Hyalangium versicolor TaxID=2861190 RepID=UPI001CCA68BB|nr:LLM class flavin-dependent oxidoreductase [Hyalangium versicolor]